MKPKRPVLDIEAAQRKYLDSLYERDCKNAKNRAMLVGEEAAGPPEPPKKRRGVMNKTEEAYSEYLEWLRTGGALQIVERWVFEGVKLRLADGAWYTPDFLVILVGGLIEFHEVKGFWREAARVRIKVAAEQHPWAKFIAVKRAKLFETGDGFRWKIERF